ncbi:RnfABCDGE type electron transport complex subunit G [Fusobacterium necrophorum]|uniref:Ion-translocating oxidoreductase complex subunit G n=1 Tax=Fusobacterium necrophorum DJ-2 TaxID=1441737 RepID=A0AB73C149_9FUSO|nr:RnfABCDGE type electron transport complex subunit G [Fusobacterium necrophorum]KDE62401.1 nitrogen fixation protein RNFG [Fusobacterium necrophorum DJ-1]KDE65074.1 nitrogen fixation protein RNFG [Fusobacterium necrophorum BFTR-1]KDE68043.1 nitrogen fixation protein RNFG [Fusobacterium necrophorum DAB]KDE70210.1 nitrogen fixation protein RNFG [Fusobacterium necrophorum DJ-2]MBR8733937.1 Na(+)-translocating ferredoxin:NAD(+) oxidoreductase complex subunit G [Fusobacterium necrophorum]
MKNKFVHYGMVLFIIAAVSAGILAAVNGFTSQVIANNAIQLVTEARKQVLPAAASFQEDEGKEVEGMLFIPGFDEAGANVGYVVSVDQNGYAGNINFVLGLDMEGKITGINIISSGETPGLGARINEAEWQSHWIGEDDSHEFNKATDAFAGATISPNAVYTGMMRTIKAYKAEVIK